MVGGGYELVRRERRLERRPERDWLGQPARCVVVGGRPVILERLDRC